MTVSGQVEYHGFCPDPSTTLKPKGFGQDTTAVAQNGAFSFEIQLPESYVVMVGETDCVSSWMGDLGAGIILQLSLSQLS
jgi:hypothetical protein